MKKRTISGVCYALILIGIFCLRQFVDYRLFHALTCFLVIMGTFEFARAFKNQIIKGARELSFVFSVLFVPVYCLGEYIIIGKAGWIFALALILLMEIITSILAIIQKANKKQFLSSISLYLYPALFLLTMLLANDMGANAFIVLLLAFVVSPCSDSMAYFVGSLIGGKKLCPKISPNKTWAGAIGGTIGGVISGIVVYLIFNPVVNFFSPILFFVLVGLFASIATLFGDLFESLIKRSVGIKDMGKIMPGHGGVLDRIDGTMFAMTFIYLVFLFV